MTDRHQITHKLQASTLARLDPDAPRSGQIARAVRDGLRVFDEIDRSELDFSPPAADERAKVSVRYPAAIWYRLLVAREVMASIAGRRVTITEAAERLVVLGLSRPPLAADLRRLMASAPSRPCPDCDGVGYRAAHAWGCDGGCGNCPVQEPCETCAGSGAIPSGEVSP